MAICLSNKSVWKGSQCEKAIHLPTTTTTLKNGSHRWTSSSEKKWTKITIQQIIPSVAIGYCAYYLAAFCFHTPSLRQISNSCKWNGVPNIHKIMKIQSCIFQHAGFDTEVNLVSAYLNIVSQCPYPMAVANNYKIIAASSEYKSPWLNVEMMMMTMMMIVVMTTAAATTTTMMVMMLFVVVVVVMVVGVVIKE